MPLIRLKRNFRGESVVKMVLLSSAAMITMGARNVTSHHFVQAATTTGQVTLRNFPYPYVAMLAVCSDADHQTKRKFELVHRFLNTHAATPMGPGLGLDISDSFYMYNGSDLRTVTDYGRVPLSQQLTYFRNTSDERYGADLIDKYIHAGWMDSLHTFGDFSMKSQGQTVFHRSLARFALNSLKQQKDYVSIWIDHGNRSNVDNFGAFGKHPFYNYQQGANPQSPFYHTDLTIAYGIHYLWPDVNSHVFVRKTVLYPIQLPDGQKIWGFWRYTNTVNPVTNKIQWLWSSNDIPKELSSQHLNDLCKREGIAVVAQHLSSSDEWMPFDENSRQAFVRLADYQNRGKILVARTSRLLNYDLARNHTQYHTTEQNGWQVIQIDRLNDPVFNSHIPTLNEVRGLTFYVPDPAHTQITIAGRPVPESYITRNPTDAHGKSIGIRWFKQDVTDYTLTSPKLTAKGH